MKKGCETGFSSRVKNKKGQLTIFIIAAIVIVVAAGAILFFFPNILVNLGIGTTNPVNFIQNCMSDEIKNAVDIVSSQGGSLNPENFILYKGDKIKYLCYASNYYETCARQQPFLKQYVEEQIKEKIKSAEENCFQSLKESFESQGFSVSLSNGETKVELIPKSVVVSFRKDLTLSKDTSQTYDRIDVVLNNNLYELLGIAESIIDWEASYGDAETTVYMDHYHDLKVEKPYKETDGTIYVLTNRNTGNKFQFASRSVIFPGGYPEIKGGENE